MDANHDNSCDSLNALEQRLSHWQPESGGLDSDRLLFAAGMAAAHRPLPRLLWPATAGCCAIVAVVMGGLLAGERTQRLALARQLHERETPEVRQQYQIAEAMPAEKANPASLWVMQRRMENNFEEQMSFASNLPAPAANVNTSVLRALRHEDLIGP